MRRTDAFSVIGFWIIIAVTIGAALNGCGTHLKIRALVLEMANRTRNVGCLVSLCIRNMKLVGLMTTDACCFDILIWSMAGCARVPVGR